jgi:hypothetical protein
VVKDSDQLAGTFDTEKTGGVLAGLLAEESDFDRRALWRTGTWGAAAVVAVVAAAMANQSSIGWRRDQLAALDLTRQTQQLQSVARESQNETRRLAAAIDTLNSDRDRLYSRITAVEQGLDSVTGAIARQNSAGSPAIAPVPWPTVPKTSTGVPSTVVPPDVIASLAPADPSPTPANQAVAPVIAPVATASPMATPLSSAAALPEKPRMEVTKLEPKPEAKPDGGPDSKPESKPEPKSDSKSDLRPEARSRLEASRLEAKSEAKTEIKTEIKTETKPEIRTGSKAEQATSAAVQGAPQLVVPAPPATTAGSASRAAISMMGPPDPAAGKLIEPTVAANAEPAQAPVVDAMASVSPKENEAAGRASGNLPAQRTEFAVDLGSANSVNGLRALWRGLRSKGVLAELHPIIVVREGNTGLGMQLRLAAGPLHDAAAAAKICATLVAGGRPCETTVFDGQRLAMSADEAQPTAGKPLPAGKSFSDRRNAPRHAINQREEPPPKTEASSSSFSLFNGKR